MAKFDQRNQTATYQYNADVINFNKVTNRTEFAQQIESLSAEIARASSLNAIEKSDAIRVQEALLHASAEAQKQEPDKSKITSLLETAGNVVKGVTALGTL